MAAQLSTVRGTTPGSLSIAVINTATSGDQTIVAAVAGKTIRVYRVYLAALAATNVTFKDGNLTDGPLPLAANGQINLATFDGEPYFVGLAGSAFIVNSSAITQMTGRVYYTQS